jgi:hypothetical protein
MFFYFLVELTGLNQNCFVRFTIFFLFKGEEDMKWVVSNYGPVSDFFKIFSHSGGIRRVLCSSRSVNHKTEGQKVFVHKIFLDKLFDTN